MSAPCRFVLRWLAPLLVLTLALGCAPARADTSVSLYKAFRGQVNFTGTEETLRTKSNTYPCRLVYGGLVYATLSGIPSGATVVSAQLYWAGSGSTADYTVNFDGVSVSAPAGRRYTSATIGGGYNYFSGAADVTNQVAAKGNGTYYFSGLSVNNGDPWCSSQGVVGGFALLVIYTHPNEAFRLLNLYEGFQYFRNNGFTLTLNNFAIPNPLPSAATGRIGHITWEGDTTLSQGGEDLLFNGYEMTDSTNPSGNQFNSASNVTGDTTSFGIDFDAYTVKYPVIQAGQTTATTTYRSGQDMVLLSAEVAALPYIPTSDLTLSMTRSGTLAVGSSTDYVISVKNGGSDTEAGPVTVVDTLPSGLNLVSTKGSGWSCASTSGSANKTIVTCTRSGSVAAGATMTPLTITVTPLTAGNYTNSATVSGQTKDSNSGNNTASDSASATDPNPGNKASLVFTSKACATGDLITAAGSTSGCPRASDQVLAAASNTVFYATNTASGPGGLVATPLSTTQATSLSVQASLACAPASGVSATYAGLTLACNGSAQAQTLQFAANSPTATLGSGAALAAFSYADVGQLSLKLAYNGISTAQPIVSRPQNIAVYAVLRARDKYPDLHDANGNASSDVAFAKAGEDFLVQLAGVMANGKYAASFGGEAAATEGKPPAINLAVSAPTGKDGALENPDNFTTAVAATSTTPGLLQGTVEWFEAGLLTLNLQMPGYLGWTYVDAANNPAPLSASRTVGRFYPDHLVTSLNDLFDCLPAMACTLQDASVPRAGVSGGAYSGEPVGFNVVAYGLQHNGADTVLALYNPAPASVSVSAVAQPNGSALGTDKGTLTLVGNAVKVNQQADQNNSSLTTSYQIVGQVGFQLPVAYDPAKPRAGNWSAPLAVYLRAVAQDTIMVAGNATPQPLTIGSQNLPSQQAPAQSPQQEDGMMVVDGRILVGNVFGSELTRVPLPLTAQYWTGSAWQTNTSDSDSVVGASLNVKNCTRSFAASCTSAALPILGWNPAPTAGGSGTQLGKGTGKAILQAPKRGSTGSVDITVNNPDAAWLPSTVGRANFGLFRSPLIYLREVY